MQDQRIIVTENYSYYQLIVTIILLYSILLYGFLDSYWIWDTVYYTTVYSET